MSSLTGDVATGKEVMRAAAGNLKRIHLELGGKAPVIVFDDADLSHATETLKVGGYLNSGQDCMAACRVYASERVYDDLLSTLVPAVESLKMGSTQDEETQLGPVISDRQRERVAGFVDRAAAEPHIEILTGGRAADGAGFFYEPTVVGPATNDDEIVKREVFGPVVSVTRFSSDEEAIRWANDVEYGLAASVFTGSGGRALNAAKHLQFGTVWINDHMPIAPEMPHGGFKQSGTGNDMSIYALEEYTEIKHVMVNLQH
jgi:acyl-CoA reductase-like NAD-dependent aldehyde dehydrogenase